VRAETAAFGASAFNIPCKPQISTSSIIVDDAADHSADQHLQDVSSEPADARSGRQCGMIATAAAVGAMACRQPHRTPFDAGGQRPGLDAIQTLQLNNHFILDADPEFFAVAVLSLTRLMSNHLLGKEALVHVAGLSV